VIELKNILKLLTKSKVNNRNIVSINLKSIIYLYPKINNEDKNKKYIIDK